MVTVSGSGVGAFADKNVGNSKAVAVSGYTLGGADANNYTAMQPAALSASISKALLAVRATDQLKQQGSADLLANSAFTTTGLVGQETVTGVTLSSLGASVAAPSGSYAISPTLAIGNHGFSSGNYNVNYIDGTLSVIPSSVNLGGLKVTGLQLLNVSGEGNTRPLLVSNLQIPSGDGKAYVRRLRIISTGVKLSADAFVN